MNEFALGILAGFIPSLLVWAHSAGKWREELSNVDERLKRVESVLDSIASNRMARR